MALVLDRAGAQQQLPVRLAGRVGEGRADHQQIAGRAHQRAVELRKAQVVADRQPHPQRLAAAAHRIERHRLAARPQRGGLVVAALAVVVAEQVDLVVARRQRTRRAVDQAAVGGVIGVAVDPQRQRAADQPDAVSCRQLGQVLLDRPAAGRFGDGELVGVVAAHHAEVFGQRHQLGARGGGFADQCGGTFEVVGQLGAGDHLDRSYLHGVHGG